MIKTIRQCSNLMIILKGSANLHSIVEWCYLISTSGIRLLDLTSSLSWSFGDDMPTSIPTQSWTLTDQRAHMTKDRPTPSDKEHLMRDRERSIVAQHKNKTEMLLYRFQSISKGSKLLACRSLLIIGSTQNILTHKQ